MRERARQSLSYRSHLPRSRPADVRGAAQPLHVPRCRGGRQENRFPSRNICDPDAIYR